MARRLERLADRADPPVHHVGRRDDVGAGLGLRQRLPHQRLDRHVVQHVAGVVDDPVLAVRRVRIERDVGDDAELGHGLLERAHGALREALRVPGFAAVIGLCRRRRDRKQRDRRNAELRDDLRLALELLDR